MSEENKQTFMEKFVALCDSGKPWYVFLGVFGTLLAVCAMVEAFTEEHIRWWVWLLDAAGLVSCVLNLRRCKKIQAEKADDAE